MKKILTKIVCLLLFTSFIIPGFACAKGAENPEVDAYVKSLEKTPDTEAAYTATTLTEDEINNLSEEEEKQYVEVGEVKEGIEYYPRYVKYESSGGFGEINNYGQYDHILYPGAIVDVSSPSISAINLKRSPVTMSIDLATTTNEDYRSYYCQNPTLSEVRKGVNKLVNTASKTTDFPTRLSISTHEVTNDTEFKLALGISGGYDGFKGNIGGDYKFGTKYSEIVFILTQIYYSIDVDRLDNPSNYFSSEHSEEKIKNELSGKIPAVVSSVKYGRVAIVRMRTTKTAESLGVDVGASYSNVAELKASFDSAQNNKDVRCSVTVYGGTVSNDSMLGVSMSLKEVIDEFNDDYCPDVAAAVPISYTLSHISDYSLAKVAFTNDQQYVKEMVKRYSTIRFSLSKIELYNGSVRQNLNNTTAMHRLSITANLIQKNDSGQEMYNVSGQVSHDPATTIENGQFNISNVNFDLRIDNKCLLEDYVFLDLNGTQFVIWCHPLNESDNWFVKLFTGQYKDELEGYLVQINGGKVAGLNNIIKEGGFYFDAQPGNSNVCKFRLYFTTEYIV